MDMPVVPHVKEALFLMLGMQFIMRAYFFLEQRHAPHSQVMVALHRTGWILEQIMVKHFKINMTDAPALDPAQPALAASSDQSAFGSSASARHAAHTEPASRATYEQDPVQGEQREGDPDAVASPTSRRPLRRVRGAKRPRATCSLPSGRVRRSKRTRLPVEQCAV